jgi:hypothetical protein
MSASSKKNQRVLEQAGWFEMAKGFSKKELEKMLTDTLIPVEPNQDYLSRLQARLVTYRGRSPVNGWMIVAILATAALIAISALGLVMRILVALGGFVGILLNRRRSRSRVDMLTT